MKDKVFGVLQRVGRSFMLPIALLPVAGLLLGIGGSFTNETMLQTYGLTGIMGPGTFLYALFTVIVCADTLSDIAENSISNKERMFFTLLDILCMFIN